MKRCYRFNVLLNCGLECNFEAELGPKSSSLRLTDIFVSKTALFHGISSKTAVSLAHYMAHGDSKVISAIKLRPIVNISDRFHRNRTTPIWEKFDTTLTSLKSIPDAKIQDIRKHFITSNPNLHEQYKTFSPSQLVAYIPCIQACHELPKVEESNIVPIVEAFKHVELHELGVYDFKIGDSFDYILDAIENDDLQSLQKLRVGSSLSRRDQVTRLYKLLPKLPKLVALNMSYNKAEAGISLHFFAKNLTHCRKIRHLYLNTMDVPAQDILVLAQNIPSQLLTLDILRNEINDTVVSCLIDTLPQTLQCLEISVRNISKHKHAELLTALHSKYHHLRNLCVHDSPFAADLVKQCGYVLQNCVHLEKLIMQSDNVKSITQDSIAVFFQGLQKARNLKRLRLFNISLEKKEFERLVYLCRRQSLELLG